MMRIALALTFVLSCVLSPSVAGAQRTWRHAGSDSLVLAAIARRGLQLADSTLLSFDADAHGFLIFLAQLGEGRLIPPRVVQSEELASRLYWWQPGRSVQRLVGRRDTTLLPASVGYYRDRYQVVLDNLPDLIRLGDGQDVRDVPHPLSQNASTLYEYARAGQTRITLPGRSIVVDEIRFRPIDDSKPAAVGSIYLDRESAAVVRLSMSFTRAAIIDQRIETLVLTLENALVRQRYWLPHRQEVEVSRKATWFDIPARGIVRGRWEVSNYQVNERIADATRQLPRWSSVSRDSLRAHPFTGRIVDVLPPDAQVATDEEVAAARKQVEEAVRAAALARPARAALSGRGVSDFVRYSRVEGFALGAGVGRRFGDMQLQLRARYGFGDEQLKGQLSVGMITGLGGPPLVRAFVEREYRDVMLPERAGVTNSGSALFFTSDYTNQVDTRAAGIAFRTSPLSAFESRIAYEQDRSTGVVVRETSNAQESVVTMWPLEGVRYENRGSGGWVPTAEQNTRGTWTTLLSLGAYNGRDNDSAHVTPLVVRIGGTMSMVRPIAGDRSIATYTHAMFVAGHEIPPQWLAYAGGPWSAPGYDFHEFSGTSMLSQRVELRQPVPAPSIPLGKYGRSPAHVVLAPYVQALAIGNVKTVQRHMGSVANSVESKQRVSGVYPSAGLGILFFYDLVRADVARGLRDGTWRFSIDIDRSFWGIL